MKIRDAVGHGDSLTHALLGSRQLFPPLFLEMVEVGEQTGTLGRVFHRLSDHYRHQVQLQRSFVKAITWPMLELAAAIFIIGGGSWGVCVVVSWRQRTTGRYFGVWLGGDEGASDLRQLCDRSWVVCGWVSGGDATWRAVDAAAAASGDGDSGHWAVAGEIGAGAADVGAALVDERRHGP